jgi:alpha-tubulin suppressor-like RCC1 family protein
MSVKWGALFDLRGVRVRAGHGLPLAGLFVAAGLLTSACGPVSPGPGTTPTSTPTPTPTLLSKPTATVYAWGDNSSGQLGNGSTTGSSVPIPVTLPAGVIPTAVSEGSGTSLVLGSNGHVYAWGDNEFGQLGDGSTNDAQTPVQVSLPAGVAAIAVAAGLDTSLALGSNGTVYAWGSNLAGQLGDGTATGPSMCGATACSTTPIAVSLPRRVRAIAIAEGGHDTSLALGSNGRVYAWGDNSSGQLGDGTTTGPGTCGGTACSVTPVAVSLPPFVIATAVSAGGATSLALGWNGRVYAWGDNTDGQLGNGTTANSDTPVPVSLPGGVPARRISEGGGTSLALGWDGRVYAWGDNTDGQLGNGTMTSSSTPAPVLMPKGVRALAVSAGGSTILAVGSDHQVYAWGDNASGQLGNGSTTNSTTPALVSLSGGAMALAVSEGSGTSLCVAISSGSTAPAVATTTTLTASPDPVAVGATVTLTAAVADADGTSPAGSVQFQVGGTGIGSPVAVSGGSASITSTFSAAGTEALSATFTPASTKYATSTGELALTVTAAGSSGGGGGEPITVTVPASGTFTVSVAPGTVSLTGAGSSATGTLEDVTVSDTRTDVPGWSASGQESDFAGAGAGVGSTIPGDQLGWTPAAVGALQGGATLGPVVTPAAPGLGSTAAVLALAAAGDGMGTNVLTANVDLLIPDGQQPGMYTGSLTITYVESAP